MLPRPSVVSTALAAPLATSVAPLTAMPTSAWLQRGRVVHAVARHADDVPGRLQALDDEELVLREHLGEAVGAVASSAARGAVRRVAQLGRARDARRARARGDLARDRQRVAGQHLDR